MFDLYTCATPNGYGVSITLEELGLPYEVKAVNLATLEHRRPEFLAMNPNGRVPVLIDHEAGLTIWESAAIRLYLAEKTGQLMPTSPKGRWDAHAWILLTNTGVSPNQANANIFYRFFPEKLPSVISRFRNETRRLYQVFDTHLKDHEYLADEYSIADCGLWPWVRICDYGAISLDEYPHLKAWFDRIGKRPAVQRGLVPAAGTGGDGDEAERYRITQTLLSL